MKETINLDDIQQKLYERLRPSGWHSPLKGFILSQDFRKILEVLLEESQDGKHFTPKLSQLFRCFEECPYSKLSVIIVSQDPYPFLVEGITVADGISFSCSNTNIIQPSLKYIFQEIESQMYPNGGYEHNLDLKRWSNQGILLLNSALTTTIGKTGVHYMIWRGFISYVLDYLCWTNPGLIYVFLGKIAQEFSDGMTTNNYQFKISYPDSVGHNGQNTWNSDNIFRKIEKTLLSTNNIKIIW